MAKGILTRLIIALLLLILCAVGATISILSEMYLICAISALGSVLAFMMVVGTVSLNTRKASFMFNAIENNDFTFQFSENVRSRNDQMFNRSLNRIKDIMQQTRDSIAQREKYYENILNHSANGIVVIDPDSGIVFQINRAAEEMLGVGALSHVNQLSVISSEIPLALIQIAEGENRSVEFYNETSKVCLTLSASMVWLNERQLKIIAMSDIGGQIENVQTESWVRLSRVLTHEIMNSLAPITSLSEQLRTTQDRATLDRGLEIIGTTGRGLIEFVDTYRRLTRVANPVLVTFSLTELLDKQVELLDAPIDLSKARSGIMVTADENLMSQVLTNLLKNAVEATQDSGSVWVNTTIDNRGKTIIEICNSGTPIADEIRENIFVPFFTTKAKGSGIGLSLSRQIMRLHNGTLTHATQTRSGVQVTVFTMHF